MREPAQNNVGMPRETGSRPAGERVERAGLAELSAEVRRIDEAVALVRRVLRAQTQALHALEEARGLLFGHHGGAQGEIGGVEGAGKAIVDCGDQGMRKLTNQEKNILSLISHGRSNRYISRRLGIAEKTVKNHIHAIFLKIGVRSRTEAAVVALRHGWILQDVRDSAPP
jgi:DNA-binding NarL/FixJ family response regulator